MSAEINRWGPWVIVLVAAIVLVLTLLADREPAVPVPGAGAGVQAPRDLAARPCAAVEASLAGLSSEDAERLLGEPGQLFLDPTSDGFAIYHAPETGEISNYFLTPSGLEPTNLGLEASDVMSFPVVVSVLAPQRYECFDEVDL